MGFLKVKIGSTFDTNAYKQFKKKIKTKKNK